MRWNGEGGEALRPRLPVFATPTRFVLYLFLVEAVAVGWLAQELPGVLAASGRQIELALILILLAVGFEEASARAARLRLRFGADLKNELASVWSFAAAVALPGGIASLVVSVILLHIWLRQERPAGELLHRKLFNTANALISLLAAGDIFRSGIAWHGDEAGLGMVVWVVTSLAVFAAVNRGLVTIGLMLVGVRWRDLVGSRDDNLIEFATLCLGALVAVAIRYEPLLAVLVILPLIALQRGAVYGQLERAASTDPKTGLLNAVAWEQVAGHELARAQRRSTLLAVLMVDIDRFKPVNDRYGHLVGDVLLKAVGRCLEAAVREYDTVARFGGEEFLIVLPDADESTALAVAERVRSRVAAISVASVIGNALAEADVLTVSVGVSVLGTDGTQLPELLHAADQAVYAAKSGGRNQVSLPNRGDGVGDLLDSV